MSAIIVVQEEDSPGVPARQVGSVVLPIDFPPTILWDNVHYIGPKWCRASNVRWAQMALLGRWPLDPLDYVALVFSRRARRERRERAQLFDGLDQGKTFTVDWFEDSFE